MKQDDDSEVLALDRQALNYSSTGFGGGDEYSMTGFEVAAMRQALAMQVSAVEFLKSMALELVLVRVEIWLTTTFHRVALAVAMTWWFGNPGFGGVTPRAVAMTTLVWHSPSSGFGPGAGFGQNRSAGSGNISSTGFGDAADSTLRSGSSWEVDLVARSLVVLLTAMEKLRFVQGSYSLPGMWLQNTLQKAQSYADYLRWTMKIFKKSPPQYNLIFNQLSCSVVWFAK
uniref:Uncharacterized protein n=1 Tax=Ditylenchus dipsaci TaxID=166011 RepID=A0A915E8K9_9BILA